MRNFSKQFWMGVMVIAIVFLPSLSTSAYAEPDVDLGVEIGQGLSNGDGMFTWSKSTLEVNGTPQPPFDLMPKVIEDILLLNSVGQCLFHSIETFFDLGIDTDSYIFGAYFMEDNFRQKDFDGFGLNWILPITWREEVISLIKEENDFIKHKTIKLGLYSDGDSNWLVKLDGKYPVYRGENYMAKFVIIYGDNNVKVIQGIIDHPMSPGGDLHIQAGYWYGGLYGIMMTKTF